MEKNLIRKERLEGQCPDWGCVISVNLLLGYIFDAWIAVTR